MATGLANSSTVDANYSKNSNANLDEKRGSKFNLTDYFNKKLSMQERYNDRIRNNNLDSSSRRQQLKNCCVITFANNQRVDIDNLLSCLKADLTEAEFGSLVQVGQYLSIKNWLIQFDSDTEFESAVNKKITMNDTVVTLLDAIEFDKKPASNASEQKFRMTVYYRILWLPNKVELVRVRDFFSQYLKGVEIDEIKREKVKSNQKLFNGTVTVKMIYETHQHQKVLDFAGLHRISSHQTLIQVSGMPSKCIGCKNYGHVRKNCPKCSKCNGHGHNTSDCNLVNRIKSNENKADNDGAFFNDDDFMGEDEEEEPAGELEAPAAEAEAAPVESTAAAAKDTAAPDANAVPLHEEPEIVVVVNSSATNNHKFSLLTADSKIFKAPSTVEVKKELMDSTTKALSQSQKQYQKRKAKITEMALGKFVEQEIAKRQIAKEEAIAEFTAMNEQAKREVLKPFHVIKKSKSTKNNGSELSSSSKYAALGETDYDNLESDCEKK
jgi:hypothetical protein